MFLFPQTHFHLILSLHLCYSDFISPLSNHSLSTSFRISLHTYPLELPKLVLIPPIHDSISSYPSYLLTFLLFRHVQSRPSHSLSRFLPITLSTPLPCSQLTPPTPRPLPAIPYLPSPPNAPRLTPPCPAPAPFRYIDDP